MTFEWIYTLLIGAISFALVWYLIYTKRRRRDLPPGPRGLPILGNILDMDPKSMTKTLRKYRQIYGDIYTIRLGSMAMTIVSGYDNMREVFQKRGDEFSHRPDNFVNTNMLRRSGTVSNYMLLKNSIESYKPTKYDG